MTITMVRATAVETAEALDWEWVPEEWTPDTARRPIQLLRGQADTTDDDPILPRRRAVRGSIDFELD
jgi:hypothetical protein